MPLLGLTVLDSSLKSPQSVVVVSLWKLSHVLYQCLSHKQELDPKEQLQYMWLLKFLEANKSTFAFDIP
jgi:hypothetical protein